MRETSDEEEDARSRAEEAQRVAERLEALVAQRRSAIHQGAPRHTGRLLGNLLVARGHVMDRELQYALEEQARSGDLLGQVLLRLGLISERTLVEALAEQLRMHVIDLDRVELDDTLGALLPEADARAMEAVPIRRRQGYVDVAVADQPRSDTAHRLSEELGAPVRLLLATHSDIGRALDRLYSHDHAGTARRPEG
ncbi:MAG TPA: hypothetical protein VN636_04040 [Acidimicrobiia bacterium]|nr:hypothetical protein [Acidimicrobiia bacterium]